MRGGVVSQIGGNDDNLTHECGAKLAKMGSWSYHGCLRGAGAATASMLVRYGMAPPILMEVHSSGIAHSNYRRQLREVGDAGCRWADESGLLWAGILLLLAVGVETEGIQLTDQLRDFNELLELLG